MQTHPFYRVANVKLCISYMAARRVFSFPSTSLEEKKVFVCVSPFPSATNKLHSFSYLLPRTLVAFLFDYQTHSIYNSA